MLYHVEVEVECRSQGNGSKLRAGEGCRRLTEHAEGFLFRAGVWRVVMSLEGKQAADGMGKWRVHDDGSE